MGAPDAAAGGGRATFARAVRWSYVMDGGGQLANVLTTFVLAGLLGPSAYGIVALASIYIMFVELILRQGMVSAIIQRKDLAEDHVHSAFWMIMGSAAVLALVSAGLSGWWASVNGIPELRGVICALSITLLLRGTVIVQEALLRRRLEFRSLAVRTLSAVVASSIVGIACAAAGAGVWSFVAQQLTFGVVEVAVLWSLVDWRPRRRFSRPAARELLGFSTGSFLASLGVFVNNRADAVLTGFFFGPVAVGLYRLAFRLVDTIVDISSRSLQSVALPGLSRLQDQDERFGQRTLEVISLSAVMSLPPLAVLSVAGDSLLEVLGKDWSAATAAMMVLCIAGAARAVGMFTGPMLQALGHPHLLAAYAWVSAGVSTGALVVTGLLVRDASVQHQVMWMAVCRAAVFSVFLAVGTFLLVRMSSATMAGLLRALRPATVAALAGGCAGWLVRLAVEAVGLPPLVVLGATGLAGVSAAVAGLLTAAPEYRHHVHGVLGSLARGRARVVLPAGVEEA